MPRAWWFTHIFIGQVSAPLLTLCFDLMREHSPVTCKVSESSLSLYRLVLMIDLLFLSLLLLGKHGWGGWGECRDSLLRPGSLAGCPALMPNLAPSVSTVSLAPQLCCVYKRCEATAREMGAWVRAVRCREAGPLALSGPFTATACWPWFGVLAHRTIKRTF